MHAGHQVPRGQAPKPRSLEGPAEKELEWYRSTVTASSDLMVFIDSTYTYRAVNQAYCDEHQRTQEEILGHTVAEVFGLSRTHRH